MTVLMTQYDGYITVIHIYQVIEQWKTKYNCQVKTGRRIQEWGWYNKWKYKHSCFQDECLR